MKITDVRLFEVRGQLPRKVGASEERQVGALDLFPEYRARTVRQYTAAELEQLVPVAAIYVQVETDAGLSGLFGPIMADQAYQIGTRLRPHLLGQDPLAVEHLWDVMARQDRHARKGTMMMAISAVDIALWDVRGKAAGWPVYRLLGGPTRAAVPAYASMLGHSLQPDLVRQRALAFRAEGYAAQKWFLRYGPGDGAAGMARNVELVRTVRETLGEDYDIMFDAWLGWDVPYTVEMGKRIAPFHPRWLEEPLQPDRIGGYAEVRRAVSVPIASGEHEYTRWGFKVLLDAEGVDVIQADPDWAGGITEMTKIIALASAYDKPVIPHGHSVLPALHLIAAQSPAVCPLLEYLVLHNPHKQWFHKEKFVPEGGLVRLPQQPGLGIELDEALIQSRRELSWD
jgi:L-alanine-DL-glutamate epimerase-like enolase superfamily enzyme